MSNFWLTVIVIASMIPLTVIVEKEITGRREEARKLKEARERHPATRWKRLRDEFEESA